MSFSFSINCRSELSPPGDAKAVVLSKQTVYTASTDNPDELLCVLPVLCCGEASYLTAKEIAVASKSFSEGEFIKTCMVKAAEVGVP